MKFKEMIYKPIDLERTKEEFMGYVKRISGAKNPEEALENVKKIQGIQRNIETQFNLASIRSDMDINDEYYEKEIEFWNSTKPIIKEWYIKYYKVLLDSEYRKELEKYLSPMFFQIAGNTVKVFDPELVSLMQEENKLIQKYRRLTASAKFQYGGKELNLSALTALLEATDREERKEANRLISGFFTENLNKFDEIYDQLVHLRNKMAKKLNFKNFYEMSYTMMNRIGYDKEDIESYRKRVLREVVPFGEKLLEKQRKRNKMDRLKNYDIDLKFLSGNASPIGGPKEIIKNGIKMYRELSVETKEFIDFMTEKGLLDLETKAGKAGGAYSEYIFDYKSPFIFANFNGTSGDVNILTHEAGHAFQAYESSSILSPELIWATSESVEIHAMSMEFFTWPWMNLFFGEDAEKYKYGHIVNAAMLICYAALVDHFQQEVYEKPDMTTKERHSTWRSLEKKYNPWIDYDGNEFYESGGRWLRQHHIFTIPFYYIEYSLAQVCALEMWKRDFYDKDKTVWDDFLEICKIGGTKSFTEIIKMANIESPFKESTLKNIVSSMEKYLQSVDEKELE